MLQGEEVLHHGARIGRGDEKAVLGMGYQLMCRASAGSDHRQTKT
jgi:hypothetical protein